MLFITVGLIGYSNEGYKKRLPPNIVWQSLCDKLSTDGDVCLPKPLVFNSSILACEFGDVSSDRKVLLYGDSHAQVINEELHKEFLRLKIKGVRIGLTNCQIVPSVVDIKQNFDSELSCSQKFEILKRYMSLSRSDIIVTSRWTFRLFPIENLITQMPYRNSEGGIERESYREYAVSFDNAYDFSAQAKNKAINEMISGLLTVNNRLLLVYPVPEIAWNITSLNWAYWQKNEAMLPEISIPYEDYLSRNKFVTSVFDSFIGKPNFFPVVPSNIFCNSFVKNRCVAQYKSVPFLL